MSEMIERIARAIRAANALDDEGPYVGFKDAERRFDARLARAAIEAMREPTDDMLEQCYGMSTSGDGDGGCYADKRDAKELWQRMIDEALNVPSTDARPAGAAHGTARA